MTGAVALPAPRAIITDTPAGLEITIPAKRSLPQLFFMGLWLAGWSAGETVVIQQLTSGGPRSIADLFLLGWLVAWTVAGGVVAHSWLWTAFGRERMVLRPAVLSLERKILGIGRARQYDLGQVSNLRVATWGDDPPDDASSRRRRVRGRQRGAVAFDYGPETVRFAEAIDHAEATQLVERLKSRHAFR